MNIVPQDEFAGVTYTEDIFPSKTYRMEIEEETGRIRRYTDGQEAVKQAVYKILRTERYQYRCYSRNYGVELNHLYGMPVSYVLPEIKRCITEALIWDSRIEAVDNFAFEVDRGKVHCTFTVHTIYGEFGAETEAQI